MRITAALPKMMTGAENNDRHLLSLPPVVGGLPTVAVNVLHQFPSGDSGRGGSGALGC